MRPPKNTVCGALVVLLFQTMGCHSFRPLGRPLPDTPRGTSQVQRTVRVTMTDGEQLELWLAWMDSAVVGGIEDRWGRQETREIPLDEVEALDEQSVSFTKTALLIISPFAIYGGFWIVWGLLAK